MAAAPLALTRAAACAARRQPPSTQQAAHCQRRVTPTEPHARVAPAVGFTRGPRPIKAAAADSTAPARADLQGGRRSRPCQRRRGGGDGVATGEARRCGGRPAFDLRFDDAKLGFKVLGRRSVRRAARSARARLVDEAFPAPGV